MITNRVILIHRLHTVLHVRPRTETGWSGKERGRIRGWDSWYLPVSLFIAQDERHQDTFFLTSIFKLGLQKPSLTIFSKWCTHHPSLPTPLSNPTNWPSTTASSSESPLAMEISLYNGKPSGTRPAACGRVVGTGANTPASSLARVHQVVARSRLRWVPWAHWLITGWYMSHWAIRLCFRFWRTCQRFMVEVRGVRGLLLSVITNFTQRSWMTFLLTCRS